MPATNCYHFSSCMYKDQNISLCRPNKCGHYEKVKKLTDVQQLKAEIADLSIWIETHSYMCTNEWIVSKLRQLSAV